MDLLVPNRYWIAERVTGGCWRAKSGNTRCSQRGKAVRAVGRAPKRRDRSQPANGIE